jgi:hypothetical protein
MSDAQQNVTLFLEAILDWSIVSALDDRMQCGRSHEQWRRTFSWYRFVGIWEHGGDHPVVEREPFDLVDDRPRNIQLVLRDLLRRGEVSFFRKVRADN